jgi:hypothetical protein
MPLSLLNLDAISGGHRHAVATVHLGTGPVTKLYGALRGLQGRPGELWGKKKNS